MIIAYNKVIGTLVLRHEDGEVVALIKDVIIHPDTGRIEGFWARPLTLPIKNAVIQSDTILEWKKNIYIRHEEEIAEPEDIIKISEILSRNTLFIGNQVKNEAQEVLGTVYDLDFDTSKLYLRNLYVQKSFLGFKYGQRVFNYDNIIKILPEYILVKDIKDKKVKAEEPALIKNKQPLLDV